MSPSLRLLAEAGEEGVVMVVVAGGETFVAKFWERALTPPPGHQGPGASVLNL